MKNVNKFEKKMVSLLTLALQEQDESRKELKDYIDALYVMRKSLGEELVSLWNLNQIKSYLSKDSANFIHLTYDNRTYYIHLKENWVNISKGSKEVRFNYLTDEVLDEVYYSITNIDYSINLNNFNADTYTSTNIDNDNKI